MNLARSCLALTLIFCGVLAARPGSLLPYAAARAKAMLNPLAGDVVAARAGAKLFRRECAGCHGEQAQGRGRAPALTLVGQAPPGALFWVLRNGSPGRRMPSFAHLPEAQRWQLITFLQGAFLPRAMPGPSPEQ